MYDGRLLLGALITKCDGATRAFDAERKSLGSFPTLKAAAAAINHAYSTAKSVSVSVSVAA
jgi:hypothetical protein